MEAAWREIRARPLVGLALILGFSATWAFVPGLVLFALLAFGLLAGWRWRIIGVFAFILGLWIAPRPPLVPVTSSVEFADVVTVVQAPRPVRGGQERVLISTGSSTYVLYFSSREMVAWHDRLFVRGTLKPVSQRSREYWWYQGVSGTLTATEMRVVGSGPFFAEWGQWIRRSFVGFVARNLSGTDAAVVDALCFNHDAELGEELRDALARSGTIHIISTSGLHVVLMAGVVAFILRLFPIPRWVQIALLLGLLIVYAAAAGFRPPMVRSVLMIVPVLVAYLFEREPDGLSAVAFSAIVTMLLMPRTVWDLGFHLSFLSVIGLVLFVRLPSAPLKTAWDVARISIGQSLRTSFVATATVAPVLSYFFGRFLIIGVVSNLLILPAVPVITCVALIAWMVEGWLPWLSVALMNGLVQPLAAYLVGVVRFCAGVPFAEIRVPRFDAFWLIPLYLFLLSLWRPVVRAADEV